jgi:TATA-box binding protein (TBP) (component of TFIID and TFIIIB)
MDDLRISTITAILQISIDIDLKKIYDSVPITEYIPFIEYGPDNPPKGFSKKMLRKKRKKTKRKMFYNQATVHVVHDGKIMNVKLFNNGKLQITGLKGVNQAPILIQKLIEYFQDLSVLSYDAFLVNHKLVLINSDFDLGYEINREVLHNEMIEAGIYSSYEPCIYPGVNIKYFMNTNQFDGICDCLEMCTGKGRADGDGDCKKVTVAVFKSGKVIITGGQHTNQLETAYRFIRNFIDERKELFVLK